MRFIHLSDLHIGKRVNERSLIDEQRYILDEICDIIREQRPDGVIIAGDVYDKANPSTEALMLFDEFLFHLSQLDVKVFIISGNHDSAERVTYGGRILSRYQIYLSPLYDGVVEPIVLNDEYGPVNVYLLPFVKPALVRHFVDEEEREKINSYNAAIARVIDDMHVDAGERNLLVTHQFITDSQRCESEDVPIGGLDNVDAELFDAFDYVALGHLHRPQQCSRPTIRYCGSPLKYSFSEVNDHKTVTLVEMKEKGQVQLSYLPLHPLHDWHDLRGTYDELTALKFYKDTPYTEDFVRITLTDEEDIPDAIGKLRSIYHGLMELRYDNTRTRAGQIVVEGATDVQHKTPLQLFAELYEMQNGSPLSDEQQLFMNQLIGEIWKEE